VTRQSAVLAVPVLAVPALVLLLAAAPAAAQDPQLRGDPAVGGRLAARWCASCHQIAPGGVRNELAPPFAGFAGDAADQPEWLRAWLSTSHPGMPNLNLGRDEISHLIAYIASLDGRCAPRLRPVPLRLRPRTVCRAGPGLRWWRLRPSPTRACR